MYQVKKSKPGRAPLRSARRSETVDSSIPGSIRRARCTGKEHAHASSDWLSQEMRVLDRYELQRDLIETLGRTRRYSHLVPRVAACHSSFRHKVCDHRHEWAEATESCNVRLCPHDQRRRSLRLAARWEKLLFGRGELRYCVFAERNCSDLHAGLQSLYRAWNRLRKAPLWKAATRGSIAVLEVTYNREENSWHPHLNVLFEGDYIPFEALNQAWIAATHGNGKTSFIRAADAGTIRELLKYVTKLSDFVDQPEAVDTFLFSTARRRFIRTYGSFYRLPIEEEDFSGRCPDCGSTCVADVGICHASQLELDSYGVFRIAAGKLRASQQPSTEDIYIAWPRAPVERGLCDAKWDAFCRQIEEKARRDA